MKQVLLIPSGGIGPALNELSAIDTKLRLKRGISEWNRDHYDYILVTGGIFNPPEVQTLSAAQLMSAWLEQEGVRKEQILCENESLDTYENVSKGIRLLRNIGLESANITVVTQWQHAIRFRITFQIGYGKKVQIIPMHYPISFSTFGWEWIYILHHLCFPTGAHSPLVSRTRMSRTKQKSG